MEKKRRKCILHIGLPKTGTSAIQVVLAKNRELLSQHGISYPRITSDEVKKAESGLVTSGNGVGLYFDLKDSDHPSAQGSIQRFEEALKSAKENSVLVSSEHLAGSETAQAEKLAQIIESSELQPLVVVALRPFVETIASTYGQSVKRECYWGDLAQFFNERKHSISYTNVLRTFECVFGRDQILALRYQSNHFVDLFLTSIGIESGNLHLYEGRDAVINPSLDPFELEALRFLNRFKQVTYESGISDGLLDVKKGDQPPPCAESAAVPPPVLFDAINDYYREEMSEIEQNYGIELRSHYSADSPQFLPLGSLSGESETILKLLLSHHRRMHSLDSRINKLEEEIHE